MKKTTAILAMVLGLLASGIQANVLDFAGIIISVNSNPVIKVGDFVHIKVNYTASNGSINRLSASVDDSTFVLIRAAGFNNFVVVDQNPADGTVQWQFTTASGTNADVSFNTPSGTLPTCIADPNNTGNAFQIVYGNIIANGIITAIPKTRTTP